MDAPKGNIGSANPVFIFLLEHPFFFDQYFYELFRLGILTMRFRKRWLAKIHVAFTNRITGLFAGSLPSFGILTHVGRRSGKVYRNP
jgi:hypothetical protein